MRRYTSKELAGLAILGAVCVAVTALGLCSRRGYLLTDSGEGDSVVTTAADTVMSEVTSETDTVRADTRSRGKKSDGSGRKKRGDNSKPRSRRSAVGSTERVASPFEPIPGIVGRESETGNRESEIEGREL